jgi:hypothetical protein
VIVSRSAPPQASACPPAQAFARRLLEQLEQVRAPEAVWLVRIEQAQARLHEADALLLELHAAITRRAGSAPPRSP